MTTFTDLAASLLAQGIPVFPCWEKANGKIQADGKPKNPDGKNPRTAHGFKDATTDSPGKKARDLLASFLQVWLVEDRARCVDRLGWHSGVFMTPDESIGQDREIVVFQNAHALEPAYSAAGMVEEWRDSVGRLAAGNSRLVFALSVAFAGALADVVGEDSGGFHFRGASSSGKTTALKVAASVWGNPNTYPRLWRATANGLEGLAALHNDGLLIRTLANRLQGSQGSGLPAGERARQGASIAHRHGAAGGCCSCQLERNCCPP